MFKFTLKAVPALPIYQCIKSAYQQKGGRERPGLGWLGSPANGTRRPRYLQYCMSPQFRFCAEFLDSTLLLIYPKVIEKCWSILVKVAWPKTTTLLECRINAHRLNTHLQQKPVGHHSPRRSCQWVGRDIVTLCMGGQWLMHYPMFNPRPPGGGGVGSDRIRRQTWHTSPYINLTFFSKILKFFSKSFF